MQVTSGQCKYLLAVYELQPCGKVRLVHVAQRLGVSKPSVHRMFRKLQDSGMMVLEQKDGAALTEKGRAAAEQYAAGYYTALHFFQHVLKMGSSAAREIATVILESGKSTAVEELCACIRRCEKNEISMLQAALE